MRRAFPNRSERRPDGDAGDRSRVAAEITAVRLDLHDPNAMFDFHFDLEYTTKIIDGDQRPVAKPPKAFLRYAEFEFGTIAGIARIADIVIVEIIVIVAVVARPAMMVVAVVIAVSAMPVVVVAVIVTTIILPITTAAAAITTTVIISIIIVIGAGCRREGMRRTTCDRRKADRRRNDTAETDRGNK